jgi:hypothetical protein
MKSETDGCLKLPLMSKFQFDFDYCKNAKLNNEIKNNNLYFQKYFKKAPRHSAK